TSARTGATSRGGGPASIHEHEEEMMSDAAAQWFVGIDWGSEQHHVCVVDARGTRVSTRVVAHSGAGLGELVAALHALAPEASATVWVAIEVPRGPVVETLLEAGFTVFMINP